MKMKMQVYDTADSGERLVGERQQGDCQHHQHVFQHPVVEVFGLDGHQHPPDDVEMPRVHK
jgi:hypothetical protein